MFTSLCAHGLRARPPSARLFSVLFSVSIRRCFFLFAVVLLPALTGCKGILQSEGSVEVLDYADTPYSLQGATVRLFRLTPASVLSSESRVTIGVGRITNENGQVTLYARKAALRDEQWYGIEVRCPRRARSNCEVTMPLHTVLSGAQVKAGDWKITALTEAAFHKVGYGVAAGFTPDEIQQVLDDAAHTLLANPADADYEDLLAWDPADAAALRRPGPLAQLNIALSDGITTNALKLLIQEWSAALQGSLGVGSYSESVSTLAVDDGYAYLGRNLRPGGEGSPGLDVIDVRDPLHPIRVGSWLFGYSQNAVGLALQDKRVYLADSNPPESPMDPNSRGTLYIFGVHNPEEPNRVGELELPEPPSDVAVAGDYAYVTQITSNRVQVVDVSNAAYPGAVSNLVIANGARKLFVADNRLWVLGDNGLTIVNIDNPLVPVQIGALPLTGGAHAFALAGNVAYAGSSVGSGAVLHVVDVSTQSAPVLVTSVDLNAASNGALPSIRSIQVDGNSAYVAGGGVHRIDLSDPLAPRWARGLALGGLYGADELVLADGLIYAASGSDGFRILNGSALIPMPVLAGQLDVAGLSAKTVASEEAIFSPVPEEGISIFSLADPLAPEFLTLYYERQSTYPMVVSGSLAYLGDVEYGAIQVMDVSNPANPFELPAHLRLDENQEELFGMSSLAVAGHYAFATWGFRIEDPDTYEDIPVGGLFVVDVQSTDDFTILSHVPFTDHASSVAAAGDYAYVIVSGRQLNVVDISNPQTPVVTGSVTLPETVQSIALADDFVYAASGTGGVQVVNVSDPAKPRLARVVDTAGYAAVIAIADGYAYVADGPTGVLALDLADPASPAIIGNAEVRANVYTLFVQHDLVYAVTPLGLDILKKPGLASD